MRKKQRHILIVVALAAASVFLLASNGFYTLNIVTDETGTGGQPSAGVSARPGGWAGIQVTCSTAGSDTWPDSVDVEAKYTSSHAWSSLGGLTAYKADQIDGNTYLIPPGAMIRTNITDAAGSHSCTVTMAFESP